MVAGGRHQASGLRQSRTSSLAYRLTTTPIGQVCHHLCEAPARRGLVYHWLTVECLALEMAAIAQTTPVPSTVKRKAGRHSWNSRREAKRTRYIYRNDRRA